MARRPRPWSREDREAFDRFFYKVSTAIRRPGTGVPYEVSTDLPFADWQVSAA